MDALKSLLSDFDLANLLPDLTTVIGWVATALRLAVLAGPILTLVLGLVYFFKPPQEANHSFGFRCYFGMGSTSAWKYTQRLAGMILAPLGLILTIVMFFLISRYADMAPDDMVFSAVKSILWEIGLIAAAYIAINVMVAVNFDRFGNPRHPEKANHPKKTTKK